MSDKVPGWAMEMAWGVFGPHPKAVVRTPQRKLLVLGIASALLSAYRRGRESIADMADSYADVSDVKAIHSQSDRENAEYRSEEKTLRAFATAIRRLGEAE